MRKNFYKNDCNGEHMKEEMLPITHYQSMGNLKQEIREIMKKYYFADCELINISRKGSYISIVFKQKNINGK